MIRTTANKPSPPDNEAPKPWQLAAERGRDMPGLEWLGERRAAALERLERAGLPDARDEDWRYTSLAGYTERWTNYLATPVKPSSRGTRRPPPPVATDATLVDVVDGLLQPLAESAPAGLILCSLRHLPTELRARAEDLLGQPGGSPADSLVDLNTALLEDAVLISTRPGAPVGAPVHVRLRGGASRALCQARLLVDLAPDSQLTLVIEHTGEEGALVNAVAGLRLGRGSRLNLLRVQDMPDDGMLTDTTRIELGEAAFLRVISADLGSEFSRQSMTVVLAGPDSSATVDGLFVADAHRHLDNRTRLEHAAPRTTSRESFRGVADGHGRGVFNGQVIVRPGAAGSSAALSNRNLLLAPTAEIDTKPELEIYTDDVRCSHGATTGQLDPDALFYLRSRGLPAAAARQLLTSAFLTGILDGIELPALRARLEAQLVNRLGGIPDGPGPAARALPATDEDGAA